MKYQERLDDPWYDSIIALKTQDVSKRLTVESCESKIDQCSLLSNEEIMRLFETSAGFLPVEFTKPARKGALPVTTRGQFHTSTQ